jgi:hypothetical protein
VLARPVSKPRRLVVIPGLFVVAAMLTCSAAASEVIVARIAAITRAVAAERHMAVRTGHSVRAAIARVEALLPTTDSHLYDLAGG